ncbi:MAG: hypothetical protein H0S80_03685 [Desulfovibrionaceae bacterium]|nr:hypothetical protein [Desulfovibrionaceae bacterium]
MANITDHASYQEARDRADAAEERETGRFGYQSEDTQEYYAEVDAGLSISRAAWDEQFDVAPSVRRFAIVLEQMVAGRAIKPAQAFDLLAIYAIANRHRNQR